MPAPDADALCRRYRHLAAPLVRAGRAYPVATVAAVGPPPRLERVESNARLDPELAAMGREHLAAALERSPQTFDGPIAALGSIGDARLSCVSASYHAMLATCDALGTEGSDGPMRRRAEQLAAPDPLRRGSGRAATVGITLVAPHQTAAGPALVLGRRRDDLALEPGAWHVVPSGTLTPEGLRHTLVAELAEEAGLSGRAARELADGVVSLGTGFDLGRLVPDVVLCTSVLLPRRPTPSASEYQDCRELLLTPEGLDRTWRELGPRQIAPAAAAALALLEHAGPGHIVPTDAG